MKKLTEIIDSLPPELQAKIAARAEELAEEYPIAAATIRELAAERVQLQTRIAELEGALRGILNELEKARTGPDDPSIGPCQRIARAVLTTRSET